MPGHRTIERAEGWRAASAGLTTVDNPYPAGPRHAAWQLGFLSRLRRSFGATKPPNTPRDCARKGCDGLVHGGPDRLYCTPECFQASRRKPPRPCMRPGCSKPLGTCATKYCSVECRLVHTRELAQEPARVAASEALKRAQRDRAAARKRAKKAAERAAALPGQAPPAAPPRPPPPRPAPPPPRPAAERGGLLVTEMMRKAVSQQFSAAECRLAGLSDEEGAWVAAVLSARRRSA